MSTALSTLRALADLHGPRPGRRLTAVQRAAWAGRSAKVAALQARSLYETDPRPGRLDALIAAEQWLARARLVHGRALAAQAAANAEWDEAARRSVDAR